MNSNVVYLVRYIDTKAIYNVSYSFAEAVKFIESRKHKSHYEIMRGKMDLCSIPKVRLEGV